MNEEKIIRKLSNVGIIGNVILVVFKFYAGIVGKSESMVSDAVHSLSDVLTTVVAIIGIRFSRREADHDHPYGHERFECLASLVLSIVLFATGLGIGYNGLKTIISGDYATIATPSIIAMVAAVVSIVTKEAMFWYTRYYAKKINSTVFLADAWHHRSDALSSIGSLIGIAGARLGFPVMDSLACVAICICILKVAFDVLKDSISKMMDTSCGDEWDSKLEEFILSQPGVDGIDLLQSRKFGAKIYLDVEIAVDGKLSLTEAHEIAERVHDEVEKNYPDIKHIMIHENPTTSKIKKII